MEDVVVGTVATADVATADFIATADVASAKKAIEGENDIAIANNYMADTGYIGGNGINSNQNTSATILWVTIGVHCNWYSSRNYTWKKKCNEIKNKMVYRFSI